MRQSSAKWADQGYACSRLTCKYNRFRLFQENHSSNKAPQTRSKHESDLDSSFIRQCAQKPFLLASGPLPAGHQHIGSLLRIGRRSAYLHQRGQHLYARPLYRRTHTLLVLRRHLDSDRQSAGADHRVGCAGRRARKSHARYPQNDHAPNAQHRLWQTDLGPPHRRYLRAGTFSPANGRRF